MIDTPLVSVIVPVFNGELYIANCLNSILSQENGDLEVVVVDDGSEDSSRSLIMEFLEFDSRVSYHYQPNAGVSSARNKGLSLSVGKWVAFVDCDDELHSDFIDIVAEHDADCDLMVTGYEEVYRGCSVSYPGAYHGLINIESYIERYATLCHIRAPWGKAFRRSWISDNGLAFESEMSFGEDTVFNLEYLSLIPRICVVDSIAYRWLRFNDNSLTRKATVSEWVEFLKKYQLFLSDFFKQGVISSDSIRAHIWSRVAHAFLSVKRGKLDYKSFWEVASKLSSEFSDFDVSYLGKMSFSTVVLFTTIKVFGTGKISFSIVSALRFLNRIRARS